MDPLRAELLESPATVAYMEQAVCPFLLVPSLPREVHPFCLLTCRVMQVKEMAPRTPMASPKSSWNAGNALCKL